MNNLNFPGNVRRIVRTYQGKVPSAAAGVSGGTVNPRIEILGWNS